MPLHRLLLCAAILTLLGLDAVFLQLQGVRIGYRVAQAENRLARLQESCRVAEIEVHRRREPAALRRRAEARRVVLGVPAAGRVVRISPPDVLVARRREPEGLRIASAR